MFLTFDAYAGVGVRHLARSFSRALGSLTKNQTPGFPGAGLLSSAQAASGGCYPRQPREGV